MKQKLVTLLIVAISFMSIQFQANAKQLGEGERYKLYTLSNEEIFSFEISGVGDSCNSVSAMTEIEYLSGSQRSRVKVITPKVGFISTIVGCPDDKKVPFVIETEEFRVQAGQTVHILVPDDMKLQTR